MMDFYEHISSNKRKSYFLIFFFLVIVGLLGSVFGLIFIGSYITGVIIALIIGIIYALIMWKSGDSVILNATRAKLVKKEDDPYLINTVEGLSIAAGIPMPKVYMIKEESSNAFATGRDPQHASVTVTSGLRKKLNRAELEGVLAHEISHIKNYDIRFMMLTAVLLGIVVLLSDFIFRSFLWGGHSRGNDRGGGIVIVLILIGVVFAILAPIVANLIKFSISRKREYLADASGAKLTRYPQGLADALKKIRDDNDKVVDTSNKGVAHLFIENPLRNVKGWSNSLFATHPPINDRIKRLEGM